MPTNSQTEDNDTARLYCVGCGSKFDDVQLVYLDADSEPVCDHCVERIPIAAVGEVINWYDQPMFGSLTKQEVGEVKEVSEYV